MLKKLKNENGSVTIEATISLSSFMFAIVTVLTLVNVSIAQAKISYAINTTAKEISQYSYLYALTGINESQGNVEQGGAQAKEDIGKILTDVNTVYNEIENLGQTGNKTPENIEDIMNAWDSVSNSLGNIQDAGSSLESTLTDIADDPKNLMFGIAKLAASESFDLAKSRLIAAPLAKIMVKKHLVNSEGGNVDAYLKFLGIKPSATGSYLDGLDFTKSTLFPHGSNQIKINVSYDMKVIALLPLDFTFHFNQTAITHGWLAGESSYEKSEEVWKQNNTLWTDSTVSERSSYIRHMGIKDMLDQGYSKTAGLTDVPLYNPTTNEFAMIASMNPLWSGKGEPPKTIADLDDVALAESIERLCGKISSTTDGMNSVTTKTEVNGTTNKTKHDCSGASNKVVLVIPEDPGLKEKMNAIIANANTNGVKIEIVSGYGNGANATVDAGGKGGTGE